MMIVSIFMRILKRKLKIMIRVKGIQRVLMNAVLNCQGIVYINVIANIYV